MLESLSQVAQAIATGQRSAEETVRDCLARIDRLNPSVNGFTSLSREYALERAAHVDRARAYGKPLGPLAGVPIAVKDNIVTRFAPTTCGSRILEPFRSPYDATIVERLEAVGAVIVGKTNLDEFAMGSSCEHSAAGPTRNPWDGACVAGGSSGGSAATVTAGLVPAAIGSDTGGSIRLPASFCGVVGLKPSYGRVSRYGLVAFGSSLDQIGPITTNVLDAALMLSVIAGHDPRDSTSVDRPVADYVDILQRPAPRLRIGIPQEYFGEGLDAEVRSAVEAAIAVLEQAGGEVKPVSLPHLKYAIACYYVIAAAEASSNLARYDGVHFGYRAGDVRDIFDVYAATRGEGFGPEVKRRIMLGTFALSSGYYDQYYLKAARVRTLIKQDYERAFQDVDVIGSPVAPHTAFRLGQKLDDPMAMYLTDIYTVPASLAGLCGISIPCGFDRRGLPIGLQLTARPFAEETLLSAAHRYQLHTEYHTRRPAVAVA